MKAQGMIPPMAAGGPINVAVQRPTVNVKEAENVGEQLAAEVAHLKGQPNLLFSKHATFGPKRVTHPGIEE